MAGADAASAISGALGSIFGGVFGYLQEKERTYQQSELIDAQERQGLTQRALLAAQLGTTQTIAKVAIPAILIIAAGIWYYAEKKAKK